MGHPADRDHPTEPESLDQGKGDERKASICKNAIRLVSYLEGIKYFH